MERVKQKKIVDIDFFAGDATEVILKSEPTFLFMFNPFDETVLEKFLNNNGDLLKSKIMLGYSNDKQRHVLEVFGFQSVYRDPKRQLSLWKNY